MLKIQQIFLKIYRCFLYVVFHNLDSQNAGLVDVERDLHQTRSTSILKKEKRRSDPWDFLLYGPVIY